MGVRMHLDHISRRRRAGRRFSALCAVATIAATSIVAATPVTADGHVTVIADGLASPRGVATGPGGRVYVAQAGSGGGDGVVVHGHDETGAEIELLLCVGLTGAITEFDRRGNRNDLINLPSAYVSESDVCEGGLEVVGPHGVDATGRGELSITIGLGASPEARGDAAAGVPAAALFGTAHRILPNGKNKLLGDVAGFELGDPADDGLDSNPYGAAIAPDGRRLVADAGGNTLVSVGEGGTALEAIFLPLCVPWNPDFGPNPVPPEFNPCGDQALFPAQAVPTSVDVGPDGAAYVGLLGGFPFAPGTSPVYRLDPSHAGPSICSGLPGVPSAGCSVYEGGLTSIVDIEFGPDGSLYVVQFSDAGVFGGLFGGVPGSVQHVPWGGGGHSTAVGGLSTPGGVAVGDGGLWITNDSLSQTDGQLLHAPLS